MPEFPVRLEAGEDAELMGLEAGGDAEPISAVMGGEDGVDSG
jgi:hypothetical protein